MAVFVIRERLPISKKFSLSEQYDFWSYRQLGDSNLSEIDHLGTTMALPPGPPQPPSITTAHTFLNQRDSNTPDSEAGARNTAVSLCGRSLDVWSGLVRPRRLE